MNILLKLALDYLQSHPDQIKELISTLIDKWIENLKSVKK